MDRTNNSGSTVEPEYPEPFVFSCRLEILFIANTPTMDAFEDNTFGQPESDPAAEFLAREQDALAGLDDDLAIKSEMEQPGLLIDTGHMK